MPSVSPSSDPVGPNTTTSARSKHAQSPSSESVLLRRILLPLVGLTICVLTYAYGVHMRRDIVFDEIGLQNPVYTFYTTGHMTYPMHGQPDFMVVHPPTHYAITAVLMKFGLPLFTAAAIPLVVLSAILALVILTGAYSTLEATALLLAYFVALTTWSEFYTLRPDLHVSAAWFTALVTLESARRGEWHSGRLFLGSALAVLTASVHYWGVSALLLPLIYGALMVRTRGLRRSRRQIVSIAAGGCLVGIPFLVWFIPLRGPIMEMVSSVQSGGTPLNAFKRHLASYHEFALRLPHTWMTRALASVVSAPVLLSGVPAVFVAVPLLVWKKETRWLALAGALLPLFVLFFSQGKQVGYTGYFTPEFMLLFAAILIAFFSLTEKARPRIVGRTGWTAGVIVVVSLLAFSGVPTSMGNAWVWTEQLDALDVIRGAARRVIGSRAVVAVTSAGVWFTGGGTFVWHAFNELVAANRQHADVKAMLAPMDAIVLDTNWWVAEKNLAPTGTWYTDRLLNLKGFVLPNGANTRYMMHLFLTAQPVDSVHGFFVNDDGGAEFVENANGTTMVSVLVCDHTPRLNGFSQAFYRFSFAYDREPAPDSPSIVVFGTTAPDPTPEVAGCAVRDRHLGLLRPVGLAELRADASPGPPIQFFFKRTEALASAGRVQSGAAAGQPPRISERVSRSEGSLARADDRRAASIELRPESAPRH